MHIKNQKSKYCYSFAMCFQLLSFVFYYRQSLADKVKLFKSIEEAEKKAPKKAPAPPPKRKNRKLASRFATQVNLHFPCRNFDHMSCSANFFFWGGGGGGGGGGHPRGINLTLKYLPLFSKGTPFKKKNMFGNVLKFQTIYSITFMA